MEAFDIVDMLGNPLKEGDAVLVLVPKTYASFRKAVVRGLKADRYNRQRIYVEYDDGRLYSNVEYFHIEKDTHLKFVSKPIKVWRDNGDIIKFDQKYFDQ